MINKSLFFSKASCQQVKNYSQNTDKRKNSEKRVHINLTNGPILATAQAVQKTTFSQNNSAAVAQKHRSSSQQRPKHSEVW